MSGAATPTAEPHALAQWAERELGVRVEAFEPLLAGIGLRRFYRLRLASGPGSAILPSGPGTAILRIDAAEDPTSRPAGGAPEPPLEPIRALLERAGLPVPRRYAGDPGLGLELLEDAGPESLCERFAREGPAQRHALVEVAAGLVPRLQRVTDDGSGVAAFDRCLDLPLFRYKAELFAEYSLPLALGRAPRRAEADLVREAFAWIAAHCVNAPMRLAHRDFQSQNLIVRDTPAGAPQLSMIDLQGAFLAPPEYDLVCLLRDSYLPLEESFVAELCDRVRPALPDAPAAPDFALRFDLLTLTRKGKDHARFLAAATRGNTRFLRYLAPTAAMLKAAAGRSAGVAAPLARLAELVNALPEEPLSCGP
jgi:aminoglycoside/choline kinase family phosphotransferase